MPHLRGGDQPGQTPVREPPPAPDMPAHPLWPPGTAPSTSSGIQRNGSLRSALTGDLLCPAGNKVPLTCSVWRIVLTGRSSGACWTSD